MPDVLLEIVLKGDNSCGILHNTAGTNIIIKYRKGITMNFNCQIVAQKNEYTQSVWNYGFFEFLLKK